MFQIAERVLLLGIEKLYELLNEEGMPEDEVENHLQAIASAQYNAAVDCMAARGIPDDSEKVGTRDFLAHLLVLRRAVDMLRQQMEG